jgi:hypothetical protein
MMGTGLAGADDVESLLLLLLILLLLEVLSPREFTSFCDCF